MQNIKKFMKEGMQKYIAYEIGDFIGISHFVNITECTKPTFTFYLPLAQCFPKYRIRCFHFNPIW